MPGTVNFSQVFGVAKHVSVEAIQQVGSGESLCGVYVERDSSVASPPRDRKTGRARGDILPEDVDGNKAI